MPETTISPVVDMDILRVVLPRLWKPGPLAELELALEVIDGPYKGVTYSYYNFKVSGDLPVKADDLIPVKFDTHVYESPAGFTQDEAWDRFTADLLLAWLTHATQNRESYRKLALLKTRGVH